MDVGEGWVGNKEWLYTALSEVQKWPLFPCNMFLASIYIMLYTKFENQQLPFL